MIVTGYIKDWAMTGSNRRPSACKAPALPAELIALSLKCVNILTCYNKNVKYLIK